MIASGVDVDADVGRWRLWRGRRPLKRWRYVGLWGERAMLCAARVMVGGAQQRFWALWDGERLTGSTRLLPLGVAVDGVVAHAGPIRLRWLADGAPITAACLHEGAPIWTRKQPIVAFGTIGGRVVRLRGLVDDSAGYHARDTAWRWCAGVGEAADGTAVAWNLCEGLHDGARGSERAVWSAGRAVEPVAAAIAPDLTSVTGAGGELLEADRVAVRRRHENLAGLVVSDYEQPFARFHGVLPGRIALVRGWGVLERHAARW